MKITDPDVIKNGEKDLIEAIKEDLDLSAVKEILKEQIARTVLTAKGGEIVVHDNQIAFRIDFDLNLSGSLMFDRAGNYISQTPPVPDPDGSEPEDLENLNIDDLSIDDAMEELGPGADTDVILDDDFLALDDSDEDDSADLLDSDLTGEEFSGLEHETLDEDPPPDAATQTDEIASDADEPDFNPLDSDTGDDLDDLLENGNDDELPDETISKEDIPESETDLSSLVDDVDPEMSLDDDMTDILQESRDFWEQKKDS